MTEADIKPFQQLNLIRYDVVTNRGGRREAEGLFYARW